MSAMNTNGARLALDLPMDELRNESIVNLVRGSAASAIPATGAPRVIYDYYMGSSLAFSGKESFRIDEVKIAAGRGGSLECWFNMDECQSKDATWQQLVYIRDNATREAWGIHTRCQDQGLFLYRFEPSPNLPSVLVTRVDSDKWMHLAVCIGSDGTVKTYINGILMNDQVARELDRFISGDKSFTVQLGARETKDFFYGKMCQFKFFAGVRTVDEIRVSMEEGRSANATFKSSYPIDFKLNSLENGAEHPVLYIENNTNGYPLKLDMINTSGTALKFAGGPVRDFVLSENDYHIQLRFKKQVVAADVLDSLAGTTGTEVNGWACIAGKNTALLEDWISFKRLPANTGEEFKGLQSLTLDNMRAEAMAGARNTLVEIKYNNLYYKESQSILNGSLTRHLDIISHLGKRNVPFDVSIKGSSMILNDGESKNSFDIIIRNMAGEPVRFAAAAGGAAQYSKFSLYCKEPVTFREKPVFRFRDNKFEEDTATRDKHLPKTFTCVQQNQVLGTENDELRIEVADLVTGYASGTLMLYLEYKNIPGYWDGVIPVPLQLGRIVERDNRIGINTLPAQDLHVKGNIKSEARVLDRTGILMPVGAIIAYGGNTAPEGWLLCDGKTTIRGKREYEDLFNVLNSDTTPNLRNLFIVGAGTDNGDYKLTARGGAATVVLKEDHLPKHKHTGTTDNENIFKDKSYTIMNKNAYKRHFAGGVKSEGAFTSVTLDYYCGYDSYNFEDPPKIDASVKEQHAHGFTTSEYGKDQAHENLPPYYALTYIIKY